MQLPELQQAIQKLLEDEGYTQQVSYTPAHPTHYILNPEVVSLVLSTLKFEIKLVKKEEK